MKLKTLFEGLVDCDAAGLDRITVTGVTVDSRHVRPGYVFVAVPGRHHDGLAFVGDAVERGAVAVVTETGHNGFKAPVTARTGNTRSAAALLASRFRGNPADRLRVVGTTGTNGKTTVNYLLRDILKQADLNPGLIGTIAYEIGARTIPAARTTPEASELQQLLAGMCAEGCVAAVMEVSSHALDQYRCDGIAFDVAVFTNLTRDHLDYHESMEAYFAAKCRLFDGLGQGGKSATAVINRDDPWGLKLLEHPLEAAVLTYGMDAGADIRADAVRLGTDGARFRVASPWGDADMATRLMGRFNVSNALAAIAAAGSLGVPLETIVPALALAPGAPGRLEALETDASFRVFVDYAHTDDALRNVLSTVREITANRLVVVFGCGGDRDRSKRPLMGAAAAELADHLIITSDNPRSEAPEAIMEEIRAGIPAGAAVEAVVDRREAIGSAIRAAAAGDVIVIAGKGHERFQEFAHRTLPFDDRQAACEVLRDLGWHATECEGYGTVSE